MQPTQATVTSIVTSDRALFKMAIGFYERLGFRVNAEWTNKEQLYGDTLRHAHGSVSEVTLLISSQQDAVAGIRLRLTPEGPDFEQCSERAAHIMSQRESRDWRALYPAIMFAVDYISDNLTNIELPSQQYPLEGRPIEKYFVDPLGNLIGFMVGSPASTKPRPLAVDVDRVAAKLGDEDPSRQPELGSNFESTYLAGHIGQKVECAARGGDKTRIAVLTSGGDAPGMNAVVRSVVRTGIFRNCEVFAVKEGYAGLVKGGDYIVKMDWDDVRGYLSIGGTVIGTARCKEFQTHEGRKKAAVNMIVAGIDALIVCGGDGSLTGADVLRSEWPSIIEELENEGKITKELAQSHKYLRICGIVGSIDNDMAMTDITIGSVSSLERICTNVNWISATAESHSRAFVIEVMGRHCGWLALMAALSTRADYVFIPELPPLAGQWQEKLTRVVQRHRTAGRRSTIVIVAEGAIDSDVNPITSEMVKNALVEIGLDTRVTTLGHVQRGGTPVAFDRMMGTIQGAEAVAAVLAATPDSPSPMVAVKENKMSCVSLVDAVRETRKVAEAIKAKDFEKIRELRDSEFREHLDNYLIISNSDRLKPENLAKRRLNVGIIAVGAPAGGMNAAIAGAASYCFYRGHKPFVIQNSFKGLARYASVKEVSWLEIEMMFSKGGCDIGTNRTLPDIDMGMIAFNLARFNIEALLIVGGFEAFNALQMLDAARPIYPSFRIPMVVLPATISNNVPGTEQSLGIATCLNALTEYCDIVKQSADSTRRRVFLVEVQGGKSGFIAAYCSLVTGASVVYVPETGISMAQIGKDINFLTNEFRKDKGRRRQGRLVIRNEAASEAFTTHTLAEIYKSEAHGLFDVREAIPGHLQQGGLPSPIDHVRGTRYAIRCIQHLERCSELDLSIEKNSLEAATILGNEVGKLVFTPVRYLWENETEVAARRSTKMRWLPLLYIANMLSGRPTET